MGIVLFFTKLIKNLNVIISIEMKRKIIFTLLLFIGLFTYANAQIITGVVTDAGDGSPIIGVNIVEKGTTNGTITDVNGQYSLKTLGEAPILIFSFIGYDKQEFLTRLQRNKVRERESTVCLTRRATVPARVWARVRENGRE